jgi:hypothetical protein
MEGRKKLHTSRPVWASEGADVVETAMIEIDTDGTEYRAKGLTPDEQQGLKNNPDVEGAE